jgi:hypothetical protein
MCQLAKIVYVKGWSEAAEELDWLIGYVSEGMRCPDGNDDVVANLGVPMGIAKGEPEDAAGYEKSLIVHEVAMPPGPRDPAGNNDAIAPIRLSVRDPSSSTRIRVEPTLSSSPALAVVRFASDMPKLLPY